MDGIDWIYLPVVRDRWRAVVRRVMKLGHLSNSQLLKHNSAQWIYMKLSWENHCGT